MKQYRMLFGDCRVPLPPTRDESKLQWAEQLGRWVSRQRTLHKKGRLNNRRETKLIGINFEWSLVARAKTPDTSEHDLKWLEQYQKLLDFKTKNGHCMVTLTYKDKSLSNWVKNQRLRHSCNELRIDRKEPLDELEFNYRTDGTDPQASHNQMQWDKMFNVLEEFKNKHGHTNVPKDYMPLRGWFDHQKVYWRRGQLDVSRVERLVAIGVSWERKRA